MDQSHFLNVYLGVITKVANDVLEQLNILKISIPNEVVQCLVSTRTFIRLNNLNKIIRDKVLQTKRNKLRKIVYPSIQIGEIISG